MFLPTNSSPGNNNQLSNCTNDIKEWLISNNLLFNTSKLYVILCLLTSFIFLLIT